LLKYRKKGENTWLRIDAGAPVHFCD